MKHNILSEKSVGARIYHVKIQLSPENSVEANAIKNTENCTADQNEQVQVDGFLNLALSQKNYSPLESLGQEGEFFIIKAFKN